MRAIVIGATGMIGSLLVKKLLQDPAFSHIKLISRRTAGVQDPKLEEVLIDFSNIAEFEKQISSADVLFCCIGTTQQKVKGDKTAYTKIDLDIPANAARFCAANHIDKYILVSSVGADAASNTFYLQLKGKTEAAVVEQPIPTVYIMRPSFLLGKRKEFRLMEIATKGLMQVVSGVLTGGWTKYKAIQAADVAEAMVNASKLTASGQFICHYTEIKQLLTGNHRVLI